MRLLHAGGCTLLDRRRGGSTLLDRRLFHSGGFTLLDRRWFDPLPQEVVSIRLSHSQSLRLKLYATPVHHQPCATFSSDGPALNHSLRVQASSYLEFCASELPSADQLLLAHADGVLLAARPAGAAVAMTGPHHAWEASMHIKHPHEYAERTKDSTEHTLRFILKL